MDEQWMILKNAPFLQNWSSIKNAFTKPVAEVYYRPLFMISLIGDYHLGKLSPGIYHFTNLFFHLSCVLLLYKFLILSRVQKKLAFIFALLFSLHPIMLHAVAWVPGRNDLMLCFFTLLSLIYLQKFILEKKSTSLLLHFLFFICALFTKESAIALPLIFIATYYTYADLKLKKLIVLFGAWLIICLIWFTIRNSIIHYMLPIETNFFASVKNFILAFILFIGKAIIPIKQSVLPTLKNSTVVVGLISICIVVFATYKLSVTNKKTALLGLVIFFTMLFISVWFGATKSSGEHYEQRLYTSMIGVFLFLSTLKFDVDSKNFNYCIGIIICFFAIKTYTRMDIYKDQISFAEAGIKEAPDYYLFYVTKGQDRYMQKDFNSALTLFNTAIELRPDKGDVYNNRGSAYYAKRMYKEAIIDFTNAINKSPFKMEYHINRCMAYNKTNEIENTMKDLEILKKCCSAQIPQKLQMELAQKKEALNNPPAAK
jgi:tetratricopeptide (TPR) repeat protein